MHNENDENGWKCLHVDRLHLMPNFKNDLGVLTYTETSTLYVLRTSSWHQNFYNIHLALFLIITLCRSLLSFIEEGIFHIFVILKS